MVFNVTFKNISVNQRRKSAYHGNITDSSQVTHTLSHIFVLRTYHVMSSFIITYHRICNMSGTADVIYDNVTLSPLLLPARVTNRSHST